MYDRNIVQSISSFMWHLYFLYCTYSIYIKYGWIVRLYKNVYYNTVLIINYCDSHSVT